jgi:hypothetical protein
VTSDKNRRDEIAAFVEPESRLLQAYLRAAYSDAFGLARPDSGATAPLSPGELAMPLSTAGWVLAAAIDTVVTSGMNAEVATGIAVQMLRARYEASDGAVRAAIAQGVEALSRPKATPAAEPAPRPAMNSEAATLAMATRKILELHGKLGPERVKALALEALRGTVLAGQALPAASVKLEDWSPEERAALLDVAAWVLAAGIDTVVAQAGGAADRAATNRAAAVGIAVGMLIANFGATEETARAALAKGTAELRLAAVH